MKETVLGILATHIDSMLPAKSSLLCYWIKDYVRMLRQEKAAKKFRRYNRGDVVKVHLGYRIGAEEGGLHFAVVLNKADSTHNPVLTVVPLTSLKEPKQIERLYPGDIFLGSILQQMIFNKAMNNPSAALDKELSKIKWGSIALVNQITTVSKIRIYDPVKNSDSLNNIRFDAEIMDQIDDGIKKLFMYNA